MTVPDKESLEARLHDLIRYIKGGRILDAMHEFYAKADERIGRTTLKKTYCDPLDRTFMWLCAA